MTELPILFSAPMVRAIIDGRKTQTRRAVKPQPDDDYWPVGTGPTHARHCPYGQPGDRLWVRETWRAHQSFDLAAPNELPKIDGLHYEADGRPRFWDFGRLRSSIHMPRWASRITLEIVSVRVERVQDISEEDARAEGVLRSDWVNDETCEWPDSEREAFRALWDSINGHIKTPTGGHFRHSWDANPWVWVVEFHRLPNPDHGRPPGRPVD
jgi:hypothetical protein